MATQPGPDDRGRNRITSVLIIAFSALIGLAVIFLLRAPAGPEVEPGGEAMEPRVDADVDMRTPSPLPPLDIHPLGAPLTVIIRDASARTTDGQSVEIPFARLLMEIGDEPGEPLIRVRQAVVERPVIMSPPSGAGAGTGGAAGGAAALTANLPYIVVDRLVIRDGLIGEPAPTPGLPTGAWAYLWEDVDLVIRDVVLGGGGTETFAFDLSVSGQLAGQAVRVQSISGAARRLPGLSAPGASPGAPGDAPPARPARPGAVEFDADVRIGASVVAARGVLLPGGEVQLEIQADTLDFPGLQGFLEVIPEEGGGAGTVRVTRTADRTVVDLLDAAATIAGYRVEARGRAIATDELVELDAELTRGTGTGLSRLLVHGTMVPGDDPWVDLDLLADPLILADSAVTGRLSVTGPVDSLAVRGTLALLQGRGTDAERQPVLADVDLHVTGVGEDDPWARGTIEVTGDPAALGLAPGDPIRAVIAGSAALSDDGPIDATVQLDTLPLALIPMPRGVADVTGHATGGLRLGGTMDAPIMEGALRLADGGAVVTETGMEISGLQGEILLRDSLVTLDGITARAGNGALRLGGTIRLDGALDLRAEMDSVRVLDQRRARLDVDAGVSVDGTMDAPRVRATARPSGWIRESYLESEPGLDLDDPPYADLAAMAPWPAGSRLRPAAPVRPEPDSALAGVADGAVVPGSRDPLDSASIEVRVEVTPAFRLIDEDSELRGDGLVILRAEGGEVTADGAIALERGFYQSFGARFGIVGGALIFDGQDLEPRVAVRAEYHDDAPLTGDDESLTAPERFPPIEFFGYGPVSATVEEMRRPVLLPSGQLDLAQLLLLDAEPQPITGWRNPRFWRSDEGPELVAERAETQLVPLLWSYIADEAYDYVPLSAGYLRAGVITVGSRYPARVVVGPVLRAAVVVSPAVEMRLSQPFLGGVAPGIAGVYRWGGLRLEGFSEPRFHAAPALGPAFPGYETRRRTGIGIRWSSER